MKTFLRKTWLIALMLVLGASTAWAESVILTENFSASKATTNKYDCSSSLSTDANRANFDFQWSLTGNGTCFKNGIKLGTSSATGAVTSSDILSDVPTGVSFTVKVYAAVWNKDGGSLTVTYNKDETKAPNNAAITATSAEYKATDFASSTDFVFIKKSTVTSLKIASSSKRILIDKVEIVYDTDASGETPTTPQTYTFTLANNANCSFSATVDGNTIESGNSVEAGKEVTVSCTPANGYEFNGWNIYRTGNVHYPVSFEGNTFTMPEAAVTVDAYLIENTTGGSTVTFNPNPEFDFVTHPTGWPTATKEGSYKYTLDGYDYTFNLANGIYCAGTSNSSGYLMIPKNTALGLPAIPGYKLTKVIGTLNESGSPSTGSVVSVTDGSNVVGGGEGQTWNVKGSQFTYNLSGTQAGTVYYMAVSSTANCQMTHLALTYTPADPNADITATISIDDVTVEVDEYVHPVIKTNITGEYLIEYTSSDNEVVLAVDDQLLACKEGTATITAYVVSDGYTDATTTFTVTVTEAGGSTGGEVDFTGFIKNSKIDVAINSETYDIRVDLNIPKGCDKDPYSIRTTINGLSQKDGEYACAYPWLEFLKTGTYTVHVECLKDNVVVAEGNIEVTVYYPNEQPGVEPEVPVYKTLAALVAAGAPTSPAKKVTVTLTDEVITKFQGTGASRKGLFIMSGEQEIEIYCSSTALPAEWVENGTISGTLTNCDWQLYSKTWELCPDDWTELEYKAPAVTPVEPTVYASLTELVAAGAPTAEASKVTVTLTNEEIKDIYVIGANNYRNGIFLQVGERQIEIYCKNVPEAWVAGGSVSGTLVNCDWKLYNEIWELCPDDWNELEYKAPATKVLSAVNIAGQPTKTEYFTGESFDATGLTVSAVYDDETSTDVTNAAEWTITPATFTTEGTITVKVTATYKETVSAEMTYTVTVTKNPYVTIGNFTATEGTIDENISYKAFQGTAGTAPAINSGCIRLYQNGGYITITGAKGVKISEVILTTGSSNATTIIGTAIDDAEAPIEGTEVAKNTDFIVSNLSCNSISFYCLGTDKYTRLDVASIKVKYEREDIELQSIDISGEGLTHPYNRFIRYSEFNHDNIVITARYSDGTTAEVSEKAEFSDPDMTVTGQQTIHVNYTEGGKTVHNAYLIYVDNDYAVSMYADLTRTKTLYRIGETINEADAVFKGDYKSGRKDVDIETTGHYEWTKPDMTTLGKKQVRVRLIESGDNPTAEYTIYVVPANTIFFESFDKTEGKGGNDDAWSGQIASSSIKYDNEGWVSTPAGGASQCLRCGNGNTAGSATTPALGHAGSVTVSFKAAAWNSTNEKTTITVSIEGDNDSAKIIDLVKGEWNDYSVTLNGLTAESKVKFSAVQASNNRFFLDEVLITASTSATVGTLVKYIKGLYEGEGNLEGLQKIVDEILGK